MAAGQAILVVDLAFGDCGKGTIVDFLARRTGGGTVVRFNGGPQAGHNVVTPDGRHHTFSQFGSATFVPGTRTLLSRFMLIEPYAMFNEARHLAELGIDDPFDRLFIDERCVVITPAHQAANRLRELARGAAAHGTCGMGVGEATSDSLRFPDLTLRAGDLRNRHKVIDRLHAVCQAKRGELAEILRNASGHPSFGRNAVTILDPTWIDAAADGYAALADRATVLTPSEANRVVRQSESLLFEGAQGVLLDERYGFHPHTTWSTTTFANADRVLDEADWAGSRLRVGVLRTYFTRHGAGPLVTEDGSLRRALPEPHNEEAGWQGRFRVGPFDAVAARYAIEAAGPVDCLAVTHVDRVPDLPRALCSAYAIDNGEGTIRRLAVERESGLSGQQRLTEWCQKARPVYEPIPGEGSKELLDSIERETGVSIGITSDGPTAARKQASGMLGI